MKPPAYQHTQKEYWEASRNRLEMVRLHPRTPESMKFQAELLILEANKILNWEDMHLSESDFMTAHLVLMMEVMNFLEEEETRPNWRTQLWNLFARPTKRAKPAVAITFPFQHAPDQHAMRLSIYRRILVRLREGTHPPLPYRVSANILPDILRRVSTHDGSRWPIPLFEVLLEDCPQWNLAYLLLGIGYPTLPQARQVHNRYVEPKLTDLKQDLQEAAAKHLQETDVEILAHLYTPQVTQIRVLEETVAILIDLALDLLLDNPQILLDREGTPFSEQETFDRIVASGGKRTFGKPES
ncbi:MAG: hypothetical protein AAFQ98_20975 [Bacteroidota bacterium]